MSSGKTSVEGYLGRLRMRAALQVGAEWALLAAGALGLGFACVALAAGPLASPAVVLISWMGVGVLGLGAVAVLVRRLRALAGPSVAARLAAVDASLPSSVRSAIELGRAPRPDASPALVEAHAARVRAVLATVPPARVVPWKDIARRRLLLGVVGLLLAVLLVSGTERGAAGAFALFSPGARNEEGSRLAIVFGEIDARLVYPSYLDRSPDEVQDPRMLEVPLGTTIEITARPRVEAIAARLDLGPSRAPLELSADGRFTGRVVVREEGRLILRLQSPDGAWIQDATTRVVRAVPDEAPRVSLFEPEEDLVLDRPEEVLFRWEAIDDVGLASVDLVLRGPDGEEVRRRLVAFDEGAHPPSHVGLAPVDMDLLDLRPGDRVTVWIEGRDGDVVSGPNVGRSVERSLALSSEADRRREALGALAALLDRALDALADRLERPLGDDAEADTRRTDELRRGMEGLYSALERHAEGLRERDGNAGEAAQLVGMARRLRRLAHEERVLYSPRVAPANRREAIDARIATQLEDDVLTLDDRLAQARVMDAAEIARELESLRREIQSLVSELRRTGSAEARSALLAAIGRAQARARDLMARIAEMGTTVPEEFMNAAEMPSAGQSEDALRSLQEAVQRGDLERADQLLDDLSRQIDRLARALGETGESFGESRFGPRDHAMAEAMDRLAGLETEQRDLARRSNTRRGRAAERALEAAAGQENREARRLADQAAALRQGLSEIRADRLASFEQDAHERATARLRDMEDALRAGDLGEAREMAIASGRELGALSRDLDLSALMFPGHDGHTAEDASRARALDGEMRELRRQLDEALPELRSHLAPGERAEMRSDGERQRRGEQAARELGEAFEQGPDGTPLDPEASRELEDIARSMREAAEALGRTDPLESSRQQEEAGRRLTELRERLERDQQQRGGGGGGGGGERGEGNSDPRRAVRIPGADQFESPMEARRRLLDAMQEDAPAGYEDAARRYFEGLLR